jgi:hypothetical protein
MFGKKKQLDRERMVNPEWYINLAGDRGVRVSVVII